MPLRKVVQNTILVSYIAEKIKLAKKQSENSKYPSHYSPGGFCTFAQLIVELICEAKARVEQKALPLQFWKLPEWAKYYKSQVRTANKLAKTYHETAILRVLREPKNSKTYSLNAKWLIPQFAVEHNKCLLAEKVQIEQIKERAARETSIVVGSNERPKMVVKNRLSNLEEL